MQSNPRVTSLIASSFALGLFAWTGLADASPNAELEAPAPAPVEQAEQLDEQAGSSDEPERTAASSYECREQCLIEFEECLNGGDPSYCVAQRSACIAAC